MAFKVSNETKVGALAAISITFLVLGYNYLAGRGSLFSKKYTLNVTMDDVTDINTSTRVLYNGYQVGNVTDIEMGQPQGKFNVYFVINEDIYIPKGSSIKISSALLGGKALNLILSKDTNKAINGQTLAFINDTTILQSVSNVLKPLNTKINSIVFSLDSLLSNGELNQSIRNLNSSLKSFTKTSDNASKMLEDNLPKITAIMSHVESITNNLKNNNEKINLIIANLKTTSDNFAALKLKETVDKANVMLGEVGSIMEKINKGEGSLGLLVNDKGLYTNLNSTAAELDKLLKDLQKFPQKYLPIPFTKRQRKKAMEASSANQ
ncbi:MAG: MCE family protein [Bacteroidetes bacterium]|nr:MCE family protein [Bacteroidota bacterium]